MAQIGFLSVFFAVATNVVYHQQCVIAVLMNNDFNVKHFWCLEKHNIIPMRYHYYHYSAGCKSISFSYLTKHKSCLQNA